MLARDISPSRLDRAKQFLAQLVDQLGENRVGLVLFAGRAYLQMPLTSDLTAARMYIGIASPDNVPTQGTVISEALARCNGAFSSQEKKYKAIVLVSDGEDHDESAVKTARELASQGVIIHSIGIGSPGGSPLFDETTNDYKKDNEGNTIISKLNESSLKEIAEAGNGTYQLYGQSPGLVFLPYWINWQAWISVVSATMPKPIISIFSLPAGHGDLVADDRTIYPRTVSPQIVCRPRNLFL